MRVKSIEVVNLKSFKHFNLNLSPNINLLIGGNNSGKSTIIKSLLNLQYSNVLDKKDLRTGESFSKTFINVIKVSEKEKRSFASKENPKKEIGDDFTICWTTGEAIDECFFYDNNRYTITRDSQFRVAVKNSIGSNVNLEKFERFSDREDKNNFIYPFLAKRKTEFYSLNTNTEETFKVSENLQSLAAKIQKIGNSSHPQNEQFTKLCEEILGFKIGVISSIDRGNGIEPGIYVTNTEVISIRSMGDGVANIVGFIIILLTENNKLFLIEELENDIHPFALKKLLNLIIEKSKNNQFVISTHSHLVLKYLGAVSESKVFYIDWKPNDEIISDRIKIPTSQINEVENTPLKRIEILEKLGYEFHDLELYESYLLLEESSAERIIRDILIPDFVPNLYTKIKTIAANGANDLEVRFTDFNRLFVFIHTGSIYKGKAWVIADGDSTGIECISKLKSKFDSWNSDHFINLKNKYFEEYYPNRFQSKVDSILGEKNVQKKREQKKALLLEVINWSFINRQEAIKEFAISAKEIIKILKQIEKKILKK